MVEIALESLRNEGFIAFGQGAWFVRRDQQAPRKPSRGKAPHPRQMGFGFE